MQQATISQGMTDQNTEKTCVLYNADCLLCSYEINHYAAYSRAQALAIDFDDLNDSASLEKWVVDADTAARRLHVLKDGVVHAGIPGFIVLWQDMPRYRWLARLVGLPGVHRLACWSYDLVLAPIIYRLHLRRIKRRAAVS